MVTLVVVLIVSGCAAFQYLKGTFVRAFATFIVTICASIIAFSFFEVLAALLIGGPDSSLKFIPPPWMQTLVFLLLFLFSFAILQTLAQYFTRQEVNLGLWPEHFGRVFFGILSGLVLSSFLITAAAMAPLPNNYPYQRFDRNYPDAWRPNKILFNTDALASGLFGTISNGSLSGNRSFAALHPDFLDQLFLNRHGIDNDVPTITREQAITVPAKNAAWHAPEDIKDSQGNPIPPQTGYSLMLIRVGLKKSAATEAGKFTLSQLRLICKQQTAATNPFAGKGQNVYPIGYMIAKDTLQVKKLSDLIKVTREDFAGNEREKWIDFAFYVPTGSAPVILQFKLNSIVQVPPLVTTEQAPTPIPFIPSSTDPQDTTKQGDNSRPQTSNRPNQQNNTEGGGLTPLTRTLVAPPLDDYK
ncbi:MAG: CvpA family protein [Phycisphaerae bacterium]|nr:CvpA family protein [Phycisphaerae bacterium]